MLEEKLLGVLRERQTEIAQSLVEFPAVDYAAYMKQVGLYQGIGEAIIELTSLINGDEID